MNNWHTQDIELIFQQLDSSMEGLTDSEAKKRLLQEGPNALPARKPPTLLAIFLHQFANPLIFILIAAGIASILIGEASDAIFIFGVILLNSALGTYQEYNAEKSAAALQHLLKIKAKVKRDGVVKSIPSEDLVPGDIVLLETGTKVPADIRLFEVNSLLVDESFLTGESLPVEKKDTILNGDVPITEKVNMAFAGSAVTAGRAKGVVIATGLNTQVGSIAKNVSETTGGKPPLVQRMERFSAQIGYVILGISVVLALLMRVEGHDWLSIFFLVVALAVASIPEGLPVALTVALSIATKRMARRNVIVRRLTAVESLGSCTVIASDKTGTLTLNQQTVKEIYLADGRTLHVSGEGYNDEGAIHDAEGRLVAQDDLFTEFIRSSILANEGELIKKDDGNWRVTGDAMDAGFLSLGFKAGINYKEERSKITTVKEIPYESELKYAGVIFKEQNIYKACVKGALERILEFCDLHEKATGRSAGCQREIITRIADNMAARGLRVLAVAVGQVGEDAIQANKDDLANYFKNFKFLGLAGFIDPLRPEAKEAVQKCRSAGIDVLMITGDHPATAAAIATELGILEEGEEVVTGAMLSAAGHYTGKSFEQLVLSSPVFARVSPTQKFEIVDVLMRNGEFVAVTGDGVNDTPAMRRANIGVAMGSGTDVAKEVGTMIITDDNFSSIVAGVEEGRFAYDNVRKVISFLIGTGLGTVILIVGSVALDLPLPLVAVQLLWLNLVTNGIQDVTMAFEKGEADVMQRMPRDPKENIFNRQMINNTLVAGVWTGLLTIGYWYYLVHVRHCPESELPYARSLLLLLCVMLQNMHAFNSRSERKSAFAIPISHNYPLFIGIVVALGIHNLSMYLPFMQQLLHIRPATTADYWITFGLASTLFVVFEIYKLLSASVQKRRSRRFVKKQPVKF